MEPEISRCLICCQQLTSKTLDKLKNEGDLRKGLLATNLETVFVLRNVFEVPPELLQGYLEEYGICPGEWGWVKFCERCEENVNEIRRIFQRILEASREFTRLKVEMVEEIRKSVGTRGEEEPEGIEGKMQEETRLFICQRKSG